MSAEICTWCGKPVEGDHGFRLYEVAGERRAAFCRLEHIVPWAIRGAHWEPGGPVEPREVAARPRRCSQCDAELGEVHVLCVRHRGDHRISDAFCSVDDLTAWAKAGGRWR
ncbi:MAG: hypothetical protein GEU88_09265 [Solirubrobacterales bacterium]|nr:hypothetical protein [Solirubrobacterales bacterium]